MTPACTVACRACGAANRITAERAVETAVVQVDTRENPGLAARFGVRGMPAIMLQRGGKVVDQMPEARTAAVLAWFRQKGQRGSRKRARGKLSVYN